MIILVRNYLHFSVDFARIIIPKPAYYIPMIEKWRRTLDKAGSTAAVLTDLL